MRLLQILRSVSDETRLRIVLLLSHRPLCVSHLQTILRAPQVRISKHLKSLKANGMVESRVARNWRIYQLVSPADFELERLLECLRDCVSQRGSFADDFARLQAMIPDLEASGITSGPALAPKPEPPQPEEAPPGLLEEHLL